MIGGEEEVECSVSSVLVDTGGQADCGPMLASHRPQTWTDDGELPGVLQEAVWREQHDTASSRWSMRRICGVDYAMRIVPELRSGSYA